MKKRVWPLALAIALLVSGCASTDAKTPAASTGSVSSSAGPTVENKYDISSLDSYLASVQEQSADIKTFLEHEAMTQADMNEKSQELYTLWDDALNYVWAELKSSLPEEEFAALQDAQLIWIAEKETAMAEAGKEFEGGSLYPLMVNSEGAALTEARVSKLYELFR